MSLCDIHLVYFFNPAFQVYRTFMIWNLNYWVILVPTVTFIATIGEYKELIEPKYMIHSDHRSVGAAGFITAQHRVNVHTSIFSTTVTQWTEAWLASSLVTTGICTCTCNTVWNDIETDHQLSLSCYHLQAPVSPEEVGPIGRLFVESFLDHSCSKDLRRISRPLFY
jgi:hypothetical protein